jgi:S-DNA-T family DNA segregation ATPase FtsK/SpoIIIE
MDAAYGLLLQAVGVMILAGIWLFFKARNQVALARQLATGSLPAVAAPEEASKPAALPASIDRSPLAGAGRAMKAPPMDLNYTLAYLQHRYPNRAYTVPLGWQIAADNTPDCVAAHFVDDVYHVLISGQTRGGKDNLALNILFTLAHRHTPEQVQVCVIDGKGLDFASWEGKAHTWRLALDPKEIQPAMTALTRERERRGALLRQAAVSKWENYKGGDMPLLVVYVSELSLLEDAVGKSDLTSWLNSELAAGAAFGIRYIIATQTASNFATRWRSQISLYLAGFQPSQSQDQPNTGLTTTELRDAGLVPPSELIAPPVGAGVFVAVQGRMGFMVRSSLINDDQRVELLRQMPDKPVAIPARSAPAPMAKGDDAILLQLLKTGQPLPIAEEVGSAVVGHPIGRPIGLPNAINQSSEESDKVRQEPTNLRVEGTFARSDVGLPLPAEAVPFEEQRRILDAASTVRTKRQLSIKLYAVDGGQKYKWVQMVCDAAGLLSPQGGVQ